MSRHTPGEWIARPDPDGGPNDWCIGLNDDVSPVDYIAVCTRRDAPVIAAAPMLLKACELFAEYDAVEHDDFETMVTAYAEAIEATRAAIAAATGETK